MNKKELSINMTLKELGIVTGTVLDMESFTPAKRYTHSIPVKHPNDKVMNVQVHSGTTTGGLKHMLQDKVGVPVEDQVLEIDSMIVKDHKLVTEMCVRKKIIVLKTRKFNCTGQYTQSIFSFCLLSFCLISGFLCHLPTHF